MRASSVKQDVVSWAIATGGVIPSKKEDEDMSRHRHPIKRIPILVEMERVVVVIIVFLFSKEISFFFFKNIKAQKLKERKESIRLLSYKYKYRCFTRQATEKNKCSISYKNKAHLRCLRRLQVLHYFNGLFYAGSCSILLYRYDKTYFMSIQHQCTVLLYGVT